MRPRKSDIGRAVQVFFYDHAENLDRPVRIEIYGRVTSVTQKYIRVIAWDTPDNKTGDDDKTEWAIIRSTIETYTRLVPEGNK